MIKNRSDKTDRHPYSGLSFVQIEQDKGTFQTKSAENS